MKTNIPSVYAIDIDATQKVLDNVSEMFVVAVSGGSAFAYLGLIDELAIILANVKEAIGEVKDINPLEREELIKANVSEKLKKFGLLNGVSKYGIENLKQALIQLGNIVTTAKEALADGAQPEDIKYLPDVIMPLVLIYKSKGELLKEWKDIQADEAEELFILLNYLIWFILES